MVTETEFLVASRFLKYHGFTSLYTPMITLKYSFMGTNRIFFVIQDTSHISLYFEIFALVLLKGTSKLSTVSI